MSSAGPPPLRPVAYPAWLGRSLGPPPAKEKPRGPRGGTGASPAPTGPPHVMDPELVKGLQVAWRDSFPKGKEGPVQEQGGILVRNAQGAIEWRPGQPLPLDKGGSRMFKVNYQDLKPGETLVATGHTHPYSKKEGGMVGVPFSEGDFSALARPPYESMMYVRSGETVFMVKTTEKFQTLLAKTKERTGDTVKLDVDMQNAWLRAYEEASKPGGVSMKAAAEAAVVAVAKKFGLEYYRGKDTTLHRVFPPGEGEKP